VGRSSKPGAAKKLPRRKRVSNVIETPTVDDAETTDRRMLERLRSYIE
jgi:hypothetical protein